MYYCWSIDLSKAVEYTPFKLDQVIKEKNVFIILFWSL